MTDRRSFRVAIVGGGYAGFALARALDRHLDVTLIEAREAFVHNVAAIRALVKPELLKSIVIPYGRLLKRGRVTRGRAVSIDDRGAVLNDGSRVEADLFVVATGSAYAAPFKPQGDSVAEFERAQLTASSQIVENDHIVIIGAGAVGVELAGEVTAAFPRKRVTLVSGPNRLFPQYPDKLHDALVSKLGRSKVELVLGDSAINLAGLSSPAINSVALASGRTLEGLIIPVTGARVVDGPAQLLPNAQKTANGQLEVDAWLRPSSLANVFAMGDLIDTGEGMTVVATLRQAPWLAKTVLKLSEGKQLKALPAYRPWPFPPILLPLGPKTGASVLPISRKGTVVGDWLTSMIKGKSLFIPRYLKEFGQT